MTETQSPPTIELLKTDVDAWNQYRKANPDWKPNLCGANLYGANLREADLCEANLYRATVSDANALLAAIGIKVQA